MTVNPTLRVGAAEVYLSGSVICRPGQIVEITPNPVGMLPFRLQLLFVENAFLPSRIEAANQPNNIVLVTVTNFGTGFTSTSTPLNVGQIAGMPLLLDIAGYSTGMVGSLVRAITFTVYQGQP